MVAVVGASGMSIGPLASPSSSPAVAGRKHVYGRFFVRQTFSITDGFNLTLVFSQQLNLTPPSRHVKQVAFTTKLRICYST